MARACSIIESLYESTETNIPLSIFHHDCVDRGDRTPCVDREASVAESISSW